MLLIERMVDWMLTIHELIGLFFLSATQRSLHTPRRHDDREQGLKVDDRGINRMTWRASRLSLAWVVRTPAKIPTSFRLPASSLSS
jgi:hypothetical protein